MTSTGQQGFADTVRVLLAEDNADIARIVTFYLKNMRKTEVVACQNGAEAMAALADSRFDIAVLDGNMPVADGLTVLRWIRAQPALSALPVIFLTANGTGEFERQCLESGAQLVMTKPFNPGLLVREIRSLLAPAA
jgi:two-component system, chemotaxis family, chemotaxis protein CheY